MFDIRRIPVARVLLPFAAGSLAGSLDILIAGPWLLLSAGMGLWMCMLLFFRLIKPERVLPIAGFSVAAWGLFFLTGLGTGNLDKPVDPGLPDNEPVVISGRILEANVDEGGRLVTELELQAAVTTDTVFHARTIIKAYTEIIPGAGLPVPGETWIFYGRLAPIRNNGNPGEVDYASILNRNNCFYRFYSDPGLNLPSRMEYSFGRGSGAGRIRTAVSGHWSGPPEAVSLLKAVCLGDRSGLNGEMRQHYSRAGGMHVLAVSGLHVGLIWWLLQRAFSFLVRLFRREVYRVLVITALLWFYAWVTGFSSSVCRSVTMFTFFSLARLICHRYHPVNAILVSALFLLLIHPGRLLDAGFQLSYAAVLAIVTLQPWFCRMVRVRHRLLKWCWELTGVSLAAQAGTLPLVMGYFHQVPVYSLATNLVAIPLLSCIIALFVATVPLMALGAGTGVIDRLLLFLGEAMNRTMEMVSSIPGAVIGNIQMDPVFMAISMLLVFLGILVLNSPARIPRYLFVGTLCLILLWSARNRTSMLNSCQVVVHHFYRCSVVTFREGRCVDHYIWCSDPEGVAWVDRYLETAWRNRVLEGSVILVSNGYSSDPGAKEFPEPPSLGGISACCPLGPGTWIVGNDHCSGLVVTGPPDRAEAEIFTGIGTAFLLLSGEPRLSASLEELISTRKEGVVIDGSNRDWYVERMGNFTNLLYLTREQGAYILRE